MIVNMPANTTNGHSQNTLPTSTTSTSCIANNTSPTQCEYNFLKRKHDGEQSTTEGSTIVNVSEGNAIEYENQVSTTQVWKKRHIQENSGTLTDTGCFNTNNGYNSYPVTHDESMLMDTLQTGNVQHEICVSTSATNTTTTTNNNNNNSNINNNNNSNSNDNNKTNSSNNYNNNNNNNNMTFNLISNNNNNNSSFINDIFAYDANLIVPVSASLVSHNTNNTSTILPTFATPTNVCVSSANYDDGANNWQATDLLELDHRYNSGLQTEIAHLQPTVPLKATEELVLTTNNRTTAEQGQGQVQGPTQFLVAEQISSSTINTQLSRCRQSATFSLQTQQNQQQQQLLPQSSTTPMSDAEVDFEDRNLSWLLNFKFDEFPHLSPDLGANNNNNNNSILVGGKTLQIGTQQQQNVGSPSSSQKSNCCSPQSASTLHSGTQQSLPDFSRFSKGSSKASKKFEELVMEVTAAEVDGNEMAVAENVTVGSAPQRASKKPPFTYTELIEYALEDKGELTVSGIYQWISDRFPYYKSNDDRWKNSVRHNLSINPHFRKGHKAPQGAGHLWTISSGDSAENILAWEHKKQRLDLFFKMESINRERLQRLTCTSPHPDCQQHRQKQQQRQEQQQQQCVYDEAAIAAAAITREMLNSSGSGTEDGCGQNCNNNNNNQRLESTTHLVHELPFNDLMSDEELRKTAGQILNGIHREVEVQSVNSIISNYHDVLLDNEDYLNPIHKDVAVQESGLRSTNATHLPSVSYLHAQSATNSQYYVTEIDPMELGIQMSHQVDAEEVLFSDEFNLNYFGYNGANDIVA